jgi:hypothetical protein
LREPALQLLQLPEHDLGIVAALLKKLVSLPVELIEDRISVHVGLQEALRACRRTAWESRVARRGGPPVFRDLLMPGHDQIPRRTRGEVTDNGRLEVHAGSHAAMFAVCDTSQPAAIIFAWQ